MASIAEILLNDSLSLESWDFDPAVGTGATLEFAGLSQPRRLLRRSHDRRA